MEGVRADMILATAAALETWLSQLSPRPSEASRGVLGWGGEGSGVHLAATRPLAHKSGRIWTTAAARQQHATVQSLHPITIIKQTKSLSSRTTPQQRLASPPPLPPPQGAQIGTCRA